MLRLCSITRLAVSLPFFSNSRPGGMGRWDVMALAPVLSIFLRL
jgi:hypothetical protein